jgi:hypothetical protein
MSVSNFPRLGSAEHRFIDFDDEMGMTALKSFLAYREANEDKIGIVNITPSVGCLLFGTNEICVMPSLPSTTSFIGRLVGQIEVFQLITLYRPSKYLTQIFGVRSRFSAANSALNDRVTGFSHQLILAWRGDKI